MLQVWEYAFRDHVTALEGLAEDDMVSRPGGLKPGAGSGGGRASTSAHTCASLQKNKKNDLHDESKRMSVFARFPWCYLSSPSFAGPDIPPTTVDRLVETVMALRGPSFVTWVSMAMYVTPNW